MHILWAQTTIWSVKLLYVECRNLLRIIIWSILNKRPDLRQLDYLVAMRSFSLWCVAGFFLLPCPPTLRWRGSLTTIFCNPPSSISMPLYAFSSLKCMFYQRVFFLFFSLNTFNLYLSLHLSLLSININLAECLVIFIVVPVFGGSTYRKLIISGRIPYF